MLQNVIITDQPPATAGGSDTRLRPFNRGCYKAIVFLTRQANQIEQASVLHRRVTMINRTPIRSFVIAAILLTLSVGGIQTQIARAQALTDVMPTNPQITMGKFQNGLSYYIRANKKPEKRGELRLVVKTGSILEDDDQLGMA